MGRKYLSAIILIICAATVLLADDYWSGRWTLTAIDAKTQTGTIFTFPSSGGVTRLLTTGGTVNGSELVVTVRITTTGTPQFLPSPEPGNVCDYVPATARPYFERRGWETGKLKWDATNSEYFRWWSNPVTIVLGAGTTTIAVPLDPASWSSVNGKFGTYDANATAQFYQTLADAGKIGLSFGAGCFFGHGVYVANGTATFELLEFRTQ